MEQSANEKEAAKDVGSAGRVCPVCGYDLRGTPGVRCSECGTAVFENAARSRIPWMHRRYRGWMKSYVRTVWFVMFRRRAFAAEMGQRVVKQDAVLFHRISLVVATVVGVGAFAGVYATRGREWENFVYVNFDHPDFGPYHLDWFWGPLGVMWDMWWILVPVGVGMYLALEMLTWVWRQVLVIGYARDHRRRRAKRLALYFSAAAPLISLIVVGVQDFLMNLREINWPLREVWNPWDFFALVLTLVLGGYLVLPGRGIGRGGIWSGVRLAVFVPAMGATGLIAWLLVGAVIWVAGYLAIMGASIFS